MSDNTVINEPEVQHGEQEIAPTSREMASTEEQPHAEDQDIMPGGTQMDRTSQDEPAAPPTAVLQNPRSSPLDGQGGRFYLDPDTGTRKRLQAGYYIDETGHPQKREM